METRTDQTPQAASKIRHRHSPRDIDNFKRISLLIDEEVKAFNSISDSIKSLDNQIKILERSGSDTDQKEAEKLSAVKQGKEDDYERYLESIEGGEITGNILKNFTDSGLSTDTGEIGVIREIDIIGEPRQPGGIKNPIDQPRQYDVRQSIQIMVEIRFMHNEIKNSFGKKNLNYFSEIAKAKEIANSRV